MDAQFAESPLMPTLPETADEAAWLRRARVGDAAAFRELLRTHQARVFSIALRFTGRRADAEELAQDVFVQLHAALDQLQDPAHLKHWLLRTVTHRSIDRLRHEQRRPRLVPIDALNGAGDVAASEQASDPLLGARLRRLMLELAADARAVVLLRFQEDLDPTDIAAVLDMPLNTVKSHLRRSLEWLRAQIAGDDHGH